MLSIIRSSDQTKIGGEVFIHENGQLTKDVVINVSSSMMQGNDQF